MNHIHAPAPVQVSLKRFDCPTCDRRVFVVYRSYEWYGPNATCLRCGEEFNEEGRAERPFMRGWRQKNIDSVKKWYRTYKRQVAQ